MTPAVKQALIKWLFIRNTLSVNTDALFISRNKSRLTARSIQNVVKKHIVAAGINPKGLSTHKLRHTAATLMSLLLNKTGMRTTRGAFSKNSKNVKFSGSETPKKIYKKSG